MKRLIEQFSQNILDALALAQKNPLKKSYPNFSNIVFCGLGGSGIGARLVTEWLEDYLPIPTYICQGYSLPKFVNHQTLVISSSYSGETEEVLYTTDEAHNRGASIIVVTSGGQLADFCNKNNHECFFVPGGNPPRTQLAFSIIQLINIFIQLQYIPDRFLNDFIEAAETISSKQEEIQSKADEIVKLIYNKKVVVYSDDKNESIAIRARQQFNENSKILCSHHVIPEMNHNELVGWAGGNDEYAILFLNTGDLHPQNKKRFNFTRSEIGKKTSQIYELTFEEGSRVTRSLYLINVLDWASYCLAEKRSVDPVEVNVIDKLKASLL